MRKNLRVSLTLAATTAVFALAACSGSGGGSGGGGSSASAGGDPIKVGVLLGFTGPNGPTGKRALDGIQIAVDQVNKAGGVMGRKLEVVQGDDKGTPATGVSEAQKLLSQKPDVMINGVTSTVALATQPVIARAGVMSVIAFSSSDDLLSGKVDPNVVRINASNSMTGAVIGKYIDSNRTFKNVTALVENDSYGNGQLAAVKEALSGQKVNVVQINYTDTDFRVALQQAKGFQTDATLFIDAASDTGVPAFLQQYKAAGLTAPVIVAATDLPQSAADAANGSAEGVVSAETYLADQTPFIGYEGSKYLVEQYKKYSSDVPNHEVAVGYTALMTWARAANDAKSLDAAAVSKKMKGEKIAGTPFGEVNADKTGQMQAPLQLYMIKDGKIKSFDVGQ